MADIEKKEESAAAESIAGIGLEAAAWAHRMGNGLGLARFWIQEARKSPDDREQVFSALNKIEGVLNEQIRIVQELRHFSRLSVSSGLGPVSVNTVVQETVEDCRRQFGNDRNTPNFRLDLAPDLPSAKADEKLLGEVIRNLVENSIRAVQDRDDGVIEVKTCHMDDTIAIGISDNGVGIPSDIATMLFQKPISKSSASGSGFGLFLSKRLVNAWGGTIEVIKSDTEGATIQVTLKVWETSLAISPTKRALVVDDDLHWESIIHSLLSERGLTVDSANSLREAAHLVHTNDYDLALLDLRFGDNLDVGDTTGLNLANLIRERNPEALIVMLTAFANVSTVHDAFSAGVDEFIDKMGFSDVEMNRVLNKVAARRATERESIRQSQLNRLMYQILSMISHELRTPLLAIQRNAEALELGALGALTSEQAEAIGIIRSAVQREFVLLDAHLDLNRIERGAEKLDYQEHNLITVMREEVLAHKPEADHKNIKIRTQLPRKKATIKIDVNRFRVALNPLLDNAIKFSPEGSEIFIKVHIAKKHVEVRISDQGPGIKPEEIDRLLGLNFDETTNFTQRIRSSGLGLLMAKHIIDLHSGKLWIESDGKNGTTVSFRLPIKE